MIESLSLYYLFIFSVFCYLHLRYGIFLFIIALPSYLIRFEFFGIPTTLLELQLIILFLFWIFNFSQKNFKNIYTIPICLWLIAGVLAIFVSSDTKAALGLFKAYILEPVVFFFLCQNILTKNDFVYIIKAFSILTFSVFSVALLQYINILPSLSPWIYEIPKRVVSVFEYPNAISLLLAPIVVCSFVLYLQSYKGISKNLLVFIFIAGMGSMLFSSSRAGLLIVIFCCLLYLLYIKKYFHVLGILLFLSLLVMGTPHLKNNVQRIVTFSDTSTDVRLVVWQGTFQLLKAHPFMGAGLSGFPIMYEQYKLTKHTELLQYPHNIFLDVWVELGILGLLAFIYILITFFHITVKHNNLFLVFTMIALIGYGLVDSPLFKNDLIMIFWLYISLSSVFSKPSIYGGK